MREKVSGLYLYASDTLDVCVSVDCGAEAVERFGILGW